MKKLMVILLMLVVIFTITASATQEVQIDDFKVNLAIYLAVSLIGGFFGWLSKKFATNMLLAKFRNYIRIAVELTEKNWRSAIPNKLTEVQQVQAREITKTYAKKNKGFRGIFNFVERAFGTKLTNQFIDKAINDVVHALKK